MNFRNFFNLYLESEQDGDYLDAVQNNDLETAQKMVDAAAKAAGYIIRAAHSTNTHEFTEFRTSGLSAHFGTLDAANDRAFILKSFSDNVVKRPHAEARVISVFLKIENALRLPDLASLHQTERGEIVSHGKAHEAWMKNLPSTESDKFFRGEEIDEEYGDEPRTMGWESDTDFSEFLLHHGIIDTDEFWDVQYSPDKAVKLLKSKGYDGIVYENIVEDAGSDSYIIFDPSQVKIDKPIIYNQTGDIIPLSQRFNSQSNDIRY